MLFRSLTGIPGPLFWHHYKHHTEMREKMRAAYVGLKRLAKGNWEVVVWINKHNAGLVLALGYVVPEPAGEGEKSEGNPF